MRFSRILMVVAAAAMFTGCADYGGGVGVAYYGPPADVEYDGYYDGFYGPIYDGYWGDSGGFYYRTAEGGRWQRGDGAHFRHDQAPGFNHMHGMAHAAPQRPARPG